MGDPELVLSSNVEVQPSQTRETDTFELARFHFVKYQRRGKILFHLQKRSGNFAMLKASTLKISRIRMIRISKSCQVHFF